MDGRARRRGHGWPLVIALAVAGCSQATAPLDTSAPSVTSDPADNGPTTPVPIAGSHDIHPPRICPSRQLTAKVVGGGSEMSQPFLDIELTNQGTTACHLRGYVSLTAVGHPLHGPNRRVEIALHRGSFYERVDPGPRRVDLQPGHSASFGVGTVTAFQGGKHLIDIIRLTITPPGGHTPISLHVEQPASAPVGKPIPVAVTAVEAVP